MKNKIKYFVLIFSVLMLLSCKEKRSYSKTEGDKESTKPSTHKIVATEVEVIKIDKPVNGTSLNELFSDKGAFSKKEIIVKGKVVKVNNGIMDKNWVHISDGTQFEGKKELTITTLDIVKIGDVVTFKGVIALDRDFGYGYTYPILMEEGKLIKK